jgi:predicted DNA-binding protein with PD1-like motif
MGAFIRELKSGKVLAFRFTDAEIAEALSSLVKREGIDSGIISFIGSFKRVKIGYYDEKLKKYIGIELRDGPYEIVSGLGNVSLKDGEPFCHIHVAVGLRDGRMFGGHLIEGEVLLAEGFIQVLEGEPLVRRPDPDTGLAYWG